MRLTYPILRISFILLFIISSCTSTSDQQAMSEISKLLGAQKVIIGSVKGIGSLKANYKTITLSGGDLINNPEINDENILSMGALAFFDYWSIEDKNEFDGLKISIERKLNGSIKKAEASYGIDTLEMIKTNIKECVKVGNAFNTRNYDEIYSQLYFDIKDKTSVNEFKSQLNEIDSIYGVVKAFKITRFSTYSATQNDGSELPIVNYLMEVQRDSFITNIHFKYSLSKKQPGILDLNIE